MAEFEIADVWPGTVRLEPGSLLAWGKETRLDIANIKIMY